MSDTWQACCYQWSHHIKNTDSTLIPEVKQRRAQFVLGWVTAWEYWLPLMFVFHPSFCTLYLCWLTIWSFLTLIWSKVAFRLETQWTFNIWDFSSGGVEIDTIDSCSVDINEQLNTGRTTNNSHLMFRCNTERMKNLPTVFICPEILIVCWGRVQDNCIKYSKM